jgi:hypothetical protein
MMMRLIKQLEGVFLFAECVENVSVGLLPLLQGRFSPPDNPSGVSDSGVQLFQG